MCGITGFWQPVDEDNDLLAARVSAMCDTIEHRGPDDVGIWTDASCGVALGFRRLSIIDLSPLGHQPMQSVEQRYTIIFNGEIYNYRDIRDELIRSGHSFRGSSDTEVILAMFSRLGIARTLERISGMFAMAVWDGETRTLTLARDRLGKKPVYYGRHGVVWLFGSELKALRAHPAFRSIVDQASLGEFFRLSYVPAPKTIYEGIWKLPPGHFVTLRQGSESVPTPYWSAAEVAARGQLAQLQLSDAEAVNQLDVLLRDAVRRRMIADVPLGAFLSGGLDSSTIVALMQAQSAAPVKTFTIGFDVAGYNEAEAAKAVAAHLGTEHTELYVTAAEAQATIPLLPTIFDEPFADSSQIPTYLVSQLARQHVTVVLSGDGGDEVFGGYNRYFWGPRIWDRAKLLPRAMRHLLCAAVERVPPEMWDRAYSAVKPILPFKWKISRPGDKLHKLAGVMNVENDFELYRRLVSAWHHPSALVGGAHEESYDSSLGVVRGFTERMMLWDLVTYLPDDILVKVDRASMAVSLEARAPLLDHRLVEWAWRLPTELRVRNGQGKWLLRQLLYRHVPPSLVDRPKIGFGVPIDQWLRGPLRDWAEDLLSERALEADGFMRAVPIRRIWQQHLGGHHNEQTRLWPVLMFQAWRRQWLR